ncbi:MAG TPA: amino acid permease [Candidatus Megamonas gallistercoris]|nr:amino acid permease [Candidatus Megamonas gallistercoris]
MNNNEDNKMKRGLKNRHVQMIALGTSIGTGLFYGSAPTIKLVGPGIILAYALAGVFIFFIMRMVGEMSVREPVSGSFVYFANKYLSNFAGYLSGWNYWFQYLLVCFAELSAISIYVNFWLPDVPQWITVLICIIAVTTVNLINVRTFGETEFWASLIKIVAICAMIIFGFYLIFTTMGPFPDNFSNLWKNGGFFPNGAWGFAQALTIVMFSFGGTELVGIAAGEAENPEKTLPRAINEILIRILIFYIGTMVVLMTLAPWNEVGMNGSPFVQIFSNIGIPAAANILNLVVIIAALSVYNSSLYSTSRILYNLAKDGNAPKVFGSLSRRGIPMVGILVSSGLSLFLVILTYILPEKVFMYLMSSVVAALIICWSTITITHFKFRLKFIKEKRLDELHFKTFLFPYTNYFCMLFLLAIVVIMFLMGSDMIISLGALVAWVIFIYITYIFKKKK